jgi:uncharacterized OB-fold protein
LSAVVDAASGRIVAWKDSIPLRYEYTAGVAGEAFLRGLKEGRLVASKCARCGEVRIPPRTYCLECGARTRLDVEMFHIGRIAAISTAYAGGRGGRTTFVHVTFAGVSGGLVHRILHAGGRAPKVGDPAIPVFSPKEARRGSLLDIQGFRTTARRTSGND